MFVRQAVLFSLHRLSSSFDQGFQQAIGNVSVMRRFPVQIAEYLDTFFPVGVPIQQALLVATGQRKLFRGCRVIRLPT